jgi:hypothetical protein
MINNDKAQTKTFAENGEELPVQVNDPAEPTADELFAIYEKIAETRPGTRDAEIFAKIREWTFSDFSLKPHEIAGISEEELEAWQIRHRINLSSGHIRPAAIDLERGHAWGYIRRFNHVNKIHRYDGPPSTDADEIALIFSSYTW